MKKLFTILLVCSFAFSTVTFVGCGGDDAKTDDTTTDTTTDDTDDTDDDAGADE